MLPITPLEIFDFHSLKLLLSFGITTFILVITIYH